MFVKKKALVIYNGVKLKDNGSLHTPQKNTKEFLFAGRLSRNKGVDILIEAFLLLREQDVHLTLAGDGELFMKSNYHNITFAGFQTELEGYYKNADYFISLPDFENCPFATLDALSYGVPVISTAVGGVKEIIVDGYNGYFVEKNVDAVVTLIKRIVSVEDSTVMRRNAIETVREKFNVDDKIAEYKRAIETL